MQSVSRAIDCKLRLTAKQRLGKETDCQRVELIAPRMVAAIGSHVARRLRSIRCHIMGVKMSCIASGILLPGQTIVFARDMKEFGIIDMR